jgi:hypothetical protein
MGDQIWFGKFVETRPIMYIRGIQPFKYMGKLFGEVFYPEGNSLASPNKEDIAVMESLDNPAANYSTIDNKVKKE